MGIDCENCNVISHTQPQGEANDYSIARHHGQLGIDDRSSAVDPTTFAGLVSAAKVSQSAFDSAASAAFGAYYSALVGTPWATGFRKNFSRL